MTQDKEKKVILNEKLQQVLDSLGENPIDEPKITKVLDENSLKKSKAIKLAFKKHGGKLNIKDFKAMEIADFFNAMRMRILSTTDGDGIFKSTEKTENFSLPDFEEVEELNDLLANIQDTTTRQNTFQKQIIDGKDVNPDELSELVKELTSQFKTLDGMVWKISGLKKDDLSKWEQSLVSEQIFVSVRDVEKTSLGKL